MSLLPALALLLQVSVQTDISAGGGSIQASVRVPRAEQRPVTEEDRRTAFASAGARDLLTAARAARAAQDSALRAYDVTSYQRTSVGFNLRETARQRLLYRSEGAARVQWKRGVGAKLEVLGARAAVPAAGGAEDARREMDESMDLADLMAIPYYPGRDELWIFDAIGGPPEADEEGAILVHPIGEGAEAFYTYAIGDSMTFDLPRGRRLVLRELRATPRTPAWNLVSGSFWFESEGSQLVRAALRFSQEMRMWEIIKAQDPKEYAEVPLLARGLLNPLEANLEGMTIEYGLYEERFWLPRDQRAEFSAQASFMRIPVQIEQRFRYASVNGAVDVPPIEVTVSRRWRVMRDSLRAAGVDEDQRRQLMREMFARNDSLAKLERDRQCALGPRHVERRSRYQGVELPMLVELPCDRSTLASSPELAGSLLADDEQLFDGADAQLLERLLRDALPPGTIAGPPTFSSGLPLTRYNRIEGLGTGIEAEMMLGYGLQGRALGRVSLADRQLNGELTLRRLGARGPSTLTVYRRLAVSSDFGSPLSFGASLAALLYGRDEGFYHRSWGAELTGRESKGNGLDWRLFVEQQSTADLATRWSLFAGANDSRMVGNVVAEGGTFAGAALRWRGSRGVDPAGWRALWDLRAEGASGRVDELPPMMRPAIWCPECPPEPEPVRDRSYGRFLAEGTLSRGLGPLAASLTGAAGSTAGRVPAQRAFFLGGLQSIRGQSADAATGTAMWMTRAELGLNQAAVRPVVFYDMGWAGDRARWRESTTALRGAGIGLSFLDGAFRADLSRGIAPVRQTRFDLSVEARF
ncbi:MAG: ShlB/FhaC/HecB family hemolysin secretion/activation protein [Gemmatimonadota bacterium]